MVEPAPFQGSGRPACEFVGIRKSYGGVRALAGVDLRVYPGIVHAIVGENGAGKSTLMKVLAGAETADDGAVLVGGAPQAFASVEDAARAGVTIVFQELSLYPELDVLLNLFLRREPRRLGMVSRREMERLARPVLDEIGLSVDLRSPVKRLTLGERQLVEIAKALLRRSDVLILDEPNSALNAAESERLFTVMRKLRDRGVTMLYISHRLEEVFRIADIITVMRNGRVVETVPAAETTIPRVVTQMIGRNPTELQRYRQRDHVGGSPLRLEGVSVRGRVEDIDIAVAPGEIVGLAGLEGAGVKAVFDVVSGACAPDTGQLRLPDGSKAQHTIPAAVRAGIARIPADRRNEGVILGQSVVDNLAQVTAGTLGRFGFLLRRGEMRKRAAAIAESLQIKMASLDSTVNQLSGGNQQKVVLGKWLDADPDVLIFDDPTRGVDVGAKIEIYEIIARLAEDGKLILFSSSELPEYVTLCDRVLIFYQGRIRGELTGDKLTEHRLLEAINTGSVESAGAP